MFLGDNVVLLGILILTFKLMTMTLLGKFIFETILKRRREKKRKGKLPDSYIRFSVSTPQAVGSPRRHSPSESQ